MIVKTIVLAAVLIGLAGCDDNSAQSDQAGMSSFMVTSVSGRQIECISWSSYQKGGLSCDWGAK